MLRRTVSQPIGLDRDAQLSSCMSYASMQNLTVYARNRSSLVLDNDWTSIVHDQAESRQWENQGEGLAWPPIGRAVGYEGPDHDEVEVAEECEAVYAAEEDEVWNSSDLSLEVKRDIVELLHYKNRLMKTNGDLQKALDACEDSNAHLEIENSALKSQVKSMKQSIQDAEQLMEEMDGIRGALGDSETASSTLRASISKLEKEKKALIDQIDTIANEMSNLLPERELDEKKITNLSQQVKALQQELEETRMQLDEKTAIIKSKDFVINQQKASLEEFAAMEQTLKRAVKDLEGQLELALVTAGGSFLHQDGTVSAATENRFSLAEELGLMPGLPEFDDEGEEEETIEVEEEILKAIVADQKEDSREVSLEKDVVEEVKFEDVDKEVVHEMQEVTKLSDEKNVFKHDQAENVEVEQIGFCAAEEGDKLQHQRQSVDWLGEAYHSFRNGVLVACAFSLGVVLPLSVVSAALPPYHSGSGLGCSDFLWSTVRQILQPYCSVQHSSMPPW
ncbi:putative uncharacterized protein MYH16 [Clupea harengus]|uniref:KASH5-like coiled-coil domain-containing protein n=1 Tax=Clupea harengus TaxID=7950 RepID=A0A8M1KQL7_CLUHA|nr:putative uncharacterized protein MYH16 [Clupea harengus]